MGTLGGSVYQIQMNAKGPKSQTSTSDWESKCELCRPPAAVEWKCLNCSDFMCANCYKIHKHGKVTKMHTVISKSNRNSETNLLHRIRCEKHEEENLEIFCGKCDKAICKVCLITDHNAHNLVQLEAKAEQERANIRQHISEVSASKIKHFQELIKNQEAAIETFAQKDESASRDLEAKTERIIGIVKEISNKLKTENANRLESMKKHKKSLTNELAEIKKSVEEAEASLQKGNALEIVQKSYYFQKKLNTKVPDIHQPVYHDFSKFRVDKEIIMALKRECNARSYEKDYGDLLEKNKSLQLKLDKMALENEKQQKSLQSKLNAVTTRKTNMERELRNLRDLNTQMEQEKEAYSESTAVNNDSTEALKSQVMKLQMDIESLTEKCNSSVMSQRCRDLEKENERLRSENNRIQRETGATIFKLKKELQTAKTQTNKKDPEIKTKVRRSLPDAHKPKKVPEDPHEETNRRQYRRQKRYTQERKLPSNYKLFTLFAGQR